MYYYWCIMYLRVKETARRFAWCRYGVNYQTAMNVDCVNVQRTCSLDNGYVDGSILPASYLHTCTYEPFPSSHRTLHPHPLHTYIRATLATHPTVYMYILTPSYHIHANIHTHIAYTHAHIEYILYSTLSIHTRPHSHRLHTYAPQPHGYRTRYPASTANDLQLKARSRAIDSGEDHERCFG
jgi:hypothetical protein